jgi:hypothetical protein
MRRRPAPPAFTAGGLIRPPIVVALCGEHWDQTHAAVARRSAIAAKNPSFRLESRSISNPISFLPS